MILKYNNHISHKTNSCIISGHSDIASSDENDYTHTHTHTDWEFNKHYVTQR